MPNQSIKVQIYILRVVVQSFNLPLNINYCKTNLDKLY